ncbi:MAG: cysteine peptidase family C39 domain-containing protein [Candidatus Pacebacteria bacterium]|nr:cysteine peptidase family C39 domain-containing protein [Candidatus Paceibacterota bacterium]
MYSVTQKDPYGCGLACVSFLLQKQYQDVAEYIDQNKAKTYGFTCKELVNLLVKFNLNYQYKYLKPKLKKKIYDSGTIVFIKRSKRYPSGHYLVRYKDGWMDPWINFSIRAKLSSAQSGFRKRLPGSPVYALFLIN